ncbi:hypothetical protein LTR56_027774 [Elasticomyces elasticus]|nr:hypothetical protein LTR56_027774 [Elasticomyces elasticus]KAK3614392.1 hypothetical protein LTR22_027801 [Elasticomyces elasticus]KAK4903843.1 hypothetical protein LTR49_026593 [Elasticomyces elasticus]
MSDPSAMPDVANYPALEQHTGCKTGYNTMRAWASTTSQLDDPMQHGSRTSRRCWESRLTLAKVPATPSFWDATASWSPTHSPSSMFTPPSSPRVNESRWCPPNMASLTAKEKRALGEMLYTAACAALSSRAFTIRSLLPQLGMLSPLADAAGHHQLDAIVLLLAKGAELHPTHCSSSALHEAIRSDDSEIAGLLLEIGANVNSLNVYNSSKLTFAVKYSSVDMVKLILSYTPNLDQVSFAAAVHMAVWPCKPESLELLPQAGADINHPVIGGNTILHCAARAKNLETVECLLRFHADPRKRNNVGQTPLHVAEEGGCVELARRLSEATYRMHKTRALGGTSPI